MFCLLDPESLWFFFALQYIRNWTKVDPWGKKFVPEKKIVSLKEKFKKELLVGPENWTWAYSVKDESTDHYTKDDC